MNISCTNAQFISRNITELADVIIKFRELNDCYDDNLILSLEQNYWEVFDLRLCKPIYRCEFKHIKPLTEFLFQLRIDLGRIYILRETKKLPNVAEASSIKRLYRLFGYDEYIFKSNLLNHYVYDRF